MRSLHFGGAFFLCLNRGELRLYVGNYTPVLPPQRGLYHSGVKNQRWGIRRYQNEDGSLTPLGRIHYGVGAAREGAAKAGKGIAAGAKSTASAIGKAGSAVSKAVADAKEARRKNAIMKNPSKNMNKMTTEELRDYVERMRLEKAYVNEAKSVEDFKKTQNRAKEFVKNALERSANKLVDAAIDKVVTEFKKDHSLPDNDPAVKALMKAEKIAKLNDSITGLTRDKSKKYDVKDMLEHPEKYSQEDFANARTAIDAMNNISKIYNQGNKGDKGNKGGNPSGGGGDGQGDRNGGNPPTPSGNGDANGGTRNDNNPPAPSNPSGGDSGNQGGQNGGERRGRRGLFNRRNRGGDSGNQGGGNPPTPSNNGGDRNGGNPQGGGRGGDRNGGNPPTPSDNGGTRNDNNPPAPSNPSGSGRQSRADEYLRNRDSLRSQNGGTNNPPSSNSQGDRSNPPTPSGGTESTRDIGQGNPTTDTGQDAVNRIMNSGGRAADYLRNRDQYRTSNSDSSTPPSNERIQNNADELQRRAEEIARRAGLRHMHVPGYDYSQELIHYAMR